LTRKNFGISVVIEKNGMKLGVVNLQGRIELPPLDSPFVVGKQLVEAMKKDTPCIMIDFHAEATSEKRAFGFFMDGFVSAVIGTHTHVPTADETILPRGTAYITDVGMAGVEESVIGVKKELAIKKFLTLLPLTFEVAEGSVILDFVVIDIANNGKAKNIERGRWRE
jgi:metallophosphoesterase (TIGR00282 family)